MAIKSQFPALKPTADFNFAATKTLDPRITFSRASQATYYDGKTLAKAEENLLLNSATLVTQSVYTYDKVYTLSFEGTGSVVLSGAYSATLSGTGVSDRVSLTFTPTKGVLTLTPSGTVANAQLEQRDFVGPYTPTTTSAITNWQPVLLTAPAGVPRFQHDPVTGKSLGFLSERQITNSMLWSEFHGASFSDAVSISGGSFSESKMFGPDGQLVKAARFPGVPAVSAYIYKGTAVASVANTISVNVKMDDGLAPSFGSATPTSAANDFVLVLSNTAIPPTSYTVDNLGNGMYRVTGSATAGTTALGYNGVAKYTTNSTRGFRTTAWQLEANARATSYCKVDAAAFVRSADLALIDGVRLDSFYSQRGGTFVADCILSIRGVNAVFGMTFGNSIAERMDVFNSGNTTLAANNYINSMASGGASVPGAVSDNQRHVIVRRCADYSWATCVNGGTVSTSGSGQIGRKDRLGIGAPGGVSADRLDGPIARLAYYDKLLTDAQIQALARI